MRDYIEERAIHIAQYIVDNGATVRQTARQFGVSKSTVHKDVTQRLIQINPRLAKHPVPAQIKIRHFVEETLPAAISRILLNSSLL